MVFCIRADSEKNEIVLVRNCLRESGIKDPQSCMTWEKQIFCPVGGVFWRDYRNVIATVL